MRERSLRTAIKVIGSLAGLAKRLGVSPRVARKWVKDGVPDAPRGRGEVLLRSGDEAALQAAVDRLGVKVVAKSLKIREATLTRRLIEGIPPSPKEKVAELFRELESEAQTSVDDEQTFLELMKLAGETGKLPNVRSGEGIRSGKKTQGYRYTKRFARELGLNGKLLRDIESWVVGLSKRYPLWQVVGIVSLYARDPSIDLDRRDPTGRIYPTVYYQTKHQKAGDFALDTKVTSFAATNLSNVFLDFEDKMIALLQNGMVKVHVHGVTVFNYRRRSEKEERTVETAKRKEFERKRARSRSRAAATRKRVRAERAAKRKKELKKEMRAVLKPKKATRAAVKKKTSRVVPKKSKKKKKGKKR